jgi:hypothetical protein
MSLLEKLDTLVGPIEICSYGCYPYLILQCFRRYHHEYLTGYSKQSIIHSSYLIPQRTPGCNPHNSVAACSSRSLSLNDLC